VILSDMTEKIKPHASWAALAASLLLIGFQAWNHSSNEQAVAAAEHHAIVQRVELLEQDAVRRREIEDMKQRLQRIEDKLDRLAERK